MSIFNSSAIFYGNNFINGSTELNGYQNHNEPDSLKIGEQTIHKTSSLQFLG